MKQQESDTSSSEDGLAVQIPPPRSSGRRPRLDFDPDDPRAAERHYDAAVSSSAAFELEAISRR